MEKKRVQTKRINMDDIDNYFYERSLRDQGIQFIAGVDEVGRGPLVGPVVAACVILPNDFQLDGLTVNIYEATKLAMLDAIKNCPIVPEHILIDAMKLSIPIPTTSIVKGDLKSITISAASVVAKVTRDRMLYKLDEKYPMYDFKNNKGYPTKKHVEAIKKYGIIKEHRKTFKPVSEILPVKMLKVS